MPERKLPTHPGWWWYKNEPENSPEPKMIYKSRTGSLRCLGIELQDFPGTWGNEAKPNFGDEE